MTQSNPFAPGVPTEAPPANPFARPATEPAPAQQQFPFPTPQAAVATAPAAYAPPAPAAAPAAAPPALGQVGSVGAPPPSGADGADLWAMFGWLVMVLPTHLETVQKPAQYITDRDRANGNLTRERITANVVVLRGPTGTETSLPWGGDPRALPVGSKPHTHNDALPYVRKAMWLSGKLVAQVKSGLPASVGAAPSPLIGRVMKDGPDKTDPWYLAPVGAEDLNLAQQYLAAVAAGHVPHPLAP